jgi:integrase
MYIDQKKNSKGQIYFRFTYLDGDGKRRRLKSTEHPHFTDYEEAETWAKSQEAFKVSQRARSLKKLEWRSKYYQFDELLEKFRNHYKAKAPNSYITTTRYLELFVFPFFLTKKRASNVNDWHLSRNEFRDWLQTEATPSSSKKMRLAAGTINNIILSYNAFLTYLSDYNLIDADTFLKCATLPTHLINYRGYEDVIDEAERDRIFVNLEEIDVGVAEFFYILWHTGMRFSELFTMPMNYLYAGKLEGSLHDELKKHDIKYFGYIVLESQAEHDDRRRESDLSIKRKPLKSAKEISPKHFRTIPIMNLKAWNILAARFKRAEESHKKREFGPNKINYMMFEGTSWNVANLALAKAQEKLKTKRKSYHCCRHSFTTFLVGKTRSIFLARAITGHRTMKAFELYLHTYEKIALVAKQSDQEITILADSEGF